jgi:hypothetical protein
MNCRDTERLWNELLDARDTPRPDLESALDAHARACPACTAVASRYRALRLALDALPPPLTAPAESVARVVRAVEAAPPAEVIPYRRPTLTARAGWIATAAAAAIVVAIGLWRVPPGRQARLADAPMPPPAATSLASALADATSATLELARDASAPAGRVGRAVLASAALPAAEPPELDMAVGPTAAVIQSVGDRVGAGVRPLSGSAQRAFGFLLPAVAADDPGAPAVPAPPRNG